VPGGVRHLLAQPAQLQARHVRSRGALAAGFEAHVVKPVDIARLLAQLAELLEVEPDASTSDRAQPSG